MSNPSLLCVPYRFKTSKLYSQIPDSGLGDFTVTRSASNSATRVNAAGLIETVADNVPRLDYPLGGITAGCPALLVEPSVQNLALQSADFNTTWQSINSATVNTNTAISPDGTQNADTINLAAVNNSRVRQPITLANSTTYTISCFYKNIALTAGETFRMRFDNGASSPNNFVAAALIDLASGTATYSLTGTSGTGFSGTATGRVDNYGNGWYRVLLTFTVGSAGGGLGSFEVGHISPGAVRSFYAWGAQLEVGSIATSYIPTAASPVTRGAETISKTGVSSLIGQTEGTIYFEYYHNTASNAGIRNVFNLEGNVAGSFNGINFATGNNQNDLQVAVQVSSSSVVSGGTFSTSVSEGWHKVAFGYNAATSGTSFYFDGNLIATRTLTSIPAMSRIAVMARSNPFSGFGLDRQFNNRIRAFALLPTRLTNAELQALTT